MIIRYSIKGSSLSLSGKFENDEGFEGELSLSYGIEEGEGHMELEPKSIARVIRALSEATQPRNTIIDIDADDDDEPSLSS